MKDPYADRRIYRNKVSSRLGHLFRVSEGESDLLVHAEEDVEATAYAALKHARKSLIEYTRTHPSFLQAMEPIDVEPTSPPIVKEMAAAAAKAGVGPMAAVAGAVAEHVGRSIAFECRRFIVENGGDVYVEGLEEVTTGLFTVNPRERFLKLRIECEDKAGICTSSGTLGHSLSTGCADAVVVVCRSAVTADAFATALANKVKSVDDVPLLLEEAGGFSDIKGILICAAGRIGLRGCIRLA